MASQFEIRLFRRDELIRCAPLALLLALVCFAAMTRIDDTDIWWRMAAGRAMLQERVFLTRDIFSFTAANLPWDNSEWLFGVLAYAVTALCGLKGLVLGKAILVTLSLALLFRLIFTRCGNRALAIGAVFWVMLVGSSGGELGPGLVSFLFFTIVLTWLHGYVSRRARAIYLAPLFLLVWSLLSRTAALGVALIAVYGAGDLIKRICRAVRGEGRWPSLDLKALLVLIVLSITCAVVVWCAGALSLGNIFAGNPVPPMEFPSYGLMLLGAAVVLFLNVAAIDPTDSLMLLVWGLLSLTTARNIPLFALCAAPVLACQAAEAASHLPAVMTSLLERAGRWRDIALCIVLAAMLLFWAVRRPDFGLSVAGGRFPEGAVDFIEKNKPEGRLLNNPAWGGYLIWNLYPSYRVFIDGRGAGLYPPEVEQEYAEVKYGIDDWERVCDRYRINLLLIPTPDAYRNLTNSREYPFQNLIEKLWENVRWRLVYWDFQTLIYVRDIPSHGKLIAGFDYRNFDIEKEQPRYWAAPLRIQGTSEIKRYLKDHPDAVMPRSFLAMEEFKAGRFSRAAAEYEAILAINPEIHTIHHNLALIASASGDEKRAEEEYLREIELNPAFPPALNNLARLYMQRRRFDQAEELLRKALEIDPRYAHAHSNLGFIFMERGEFDDAAAEFEAVLAVYPHDRAAFHNLRIARQLELKQARPDAPRGRAYGPLTKEEAERAFPRPPGEER